VRLPWIAAEYERVCLDCGQAWRVPWAAAWRRGRMLSGPASAVGATLRDSRVTAASATACMARPDMLRADSAPGRAASGVISALRSCPRCGARRFSQRAFRPRELTVK